MNQKNDIIATVTRELIGLEEVALMLDVCQKTVRRVIEDGELGPVVKVRGSTKLFLKHVRAYVERLEMSAEGRTIK